MVLAGLAAAFAFSCNSKRSEPDKATRSAPAEHSAPAVLELTAATRLGQPLVVLEPPLVARLRARPEVLRVVPRLALRAPAQGSFALGGQQVRIEIICDGIEPDLVEEAQPAFRDWGAGPTADAPSPCGAAATACPAGLYCDERDSRCHHRVPILISPTLVELYDAQYAPAHDLPAIDPARFDPAAYRESPLRIELGRSMVTGAESKGPEPFTVEGVLVGVDQHAMAIGMTVPIGYVQRWNGELLGTAAPAGYTSLEVTLRAGASTAGFRRWAESHQLRADDLDR